MEEVILTPANTSEKSKEQILHYANGRMEFETVGCSVQLG